MSRSPRLHRSPFQIPLARRRLPVQNHVHYMHISVEVVAAARWYYIRAKRNERHFEWMNGPMHGPINELMDQIDECEWMTLRAGGGAPPRTVSHVHEQAKRGSHRRTLVKKKHEDTPTPCCDTFVRVCCVFCACGCACECACAGESQPPAAADKRMGESLATKRVWGEEKREEQERLKNPRALEAVHTT